MTEGGGFGGRGSFAAPPACGCGRAPALAEGLTGGGGFGDPLERDPQLALTDVMDEWLTVETARDYYGVAIDVVDAEALDYRIDEKKTAELRARLREKGFTEGLG